MSRAEEAGEPIFRPIFGADWERLPPVMRDHYAVRAGSRDEVEVAGLMDVALAPVTRLMAPLLRATRTLVPMAGTGVPVTVRFSCGDGETAFRFDRIFCFPGRNPWHFRSRMVPVGGNEILEITASGLGWRAAYSFSEGKVRLEHRGYGVRRFGRLIPLPLTWIFGRASAEEVAIDDHSFRMRMEIRHPLFGLVYAYGGVFRVTEMRRDG
jgi:hypothetical protein